MILKEEREKIVKTSTVVMKQRKKRDKLMRYFKFRNVNGALVPFSRDPVQVFQIILSNQFENQYNEVVFKYL